MTSRAGFRSVLLLVAATVSCSLSVPSGAERNKALVRLNVEAMNAHDPDLLAQTMSRDLVRHCQATPDLRRSGSSGTTWRC